MPRFYLKRHHKSLGSERKRYRKLGSGPAGIRFHLGVCPSLPPAIMTFPGKADAYQDSFLAGSPLLCLLPNLPQSKADLSL